MVWPIVRIAPNHYSIDDPSAVQILYGARSTFAKGEWYSVSASPDMPIRDVFTELDAKKHATHRRQIAQFYSIKTLRKMEDAVDECIKEFDQRLSEISRSGEVIDLQWWVAKRFGFLKKGEDCMNMISNIHQSLLYVARIGVYPEWHRVIFKLSSFFGNSGFAAVMDFAGKQIQERLSKWQDEETGESGDDFLTSVLRLHREDPAKFPMEKVFLTCLQNIGAGTDTTSISLSAILWNVIMDRRVLAKANLFLPPRPAVPCLTIARQLRAEIDEKTADGQLSDPPTFAETQTMPYFQAVILEGLRIHPAAAFPLVRIVPKGGAHIAGRFFPEGVSVGINCWVAHANQAVFGEDADQFRPERWLADKETVSAMNRYWIPFGHGSRTCLGKNISPMEISKAVPQLLRKYDFERADANAELECEYVCFVKQKNMKFKIIRREV
ncbi:uncharacterized protein N0V89_002818 [Didymosphaeria variabile]|uniref:Cytochrome P450 n=1 Tax=Didymosphaeria variabile TaxID=1932322 RepID=A0A9W9CEY9_9PLEO|nr:uncharacterized protein N0V89_002818 [Didymosphaeria variabile]KAJ4358238.1 hypothetical protein N0V89_002818 [Didymosphaeria variabile]